MTQTLVLAGLALRELWFSYRLLATLAVLLLASAPAAVLPHAAPASPAGAPPSPLAWYAIATGGALAVVSGLTAGGLAAGRRRGQLGWLALRPVARPRLAIGWFLACAGVMLAGLGIAALLAWVALADANLLRVGAASFAAAIGGVAALGLLGVAVGLLLGAILPPLAASVVGVLVSGAIGLAGFGRSFTDVLALPDALVLPGDLPLPTAILPLLADLDITARPIAAALPLTGVTLGITALVLLIAAGALARVDL